MRQSDDSSARTGPSHDGAGRVGVPFEEVTAAAAHRLRASGSPGIAAASGWACAWLEACAYPGIELLLEALDTTPPGEREPVLELDVLGLDLNNISCVFLGPSIARIVEERGRLFLRNVRHGLYLLPFSVKAGIGIGCPVDPSFALGGERTKNPYEEKLSLARQSGLDLPHALWTRLTQA
ncbi:MAG: hypothetical protein AB7S92_08205 [Parvibaculaceae bacterium]